MKIALIVLGAVVLAGGAALWGGRVAQRRSTERLVATLLQPGRGDQTARVDFSALDGLPDPVARYLRLALRDGQPPIVSATLRQTGELRTAPQADRWFSFEATHTVSPAGPGFVWNARVRLAPFVHLRVRDAYVAGQGSGHVTLLSAVPVGSQSGGVEVNSGSLHRYLAEAVWYPTALLPGPALRWTPLTGTSALATLTDAGLTVSLEFRFTGQGEVAAIYSPGRWGAFDGEYRQVPWEGHFRDYRRQDGLLVPAEGDVGWYVDGVWHRVWEGRVVGAYEFD